MNPAIAAGFLRSAFSLEKARNVEAVGRITYKYRHIEGQTRFNLGKHMECERVVATRVFLEKRYGVRERLVAGHRHLQSQGTQDAVYLRKHKESGGVGTARIFH